MKITDPDIIKTGEKDLIDAVKDDLDLDAVKEVLEKKLAATVLSPKGGEIVVHNNKIAFLLFPDHRLHACLPHSQNGDLRVIDNRRKKTAAHGPGIGNGKRAALHFFQTGLAFPGALHQIG